MKKMFLMLAIIASAMVSSAQKSPVSFSLGAVASLPVGKLSTTHKIGYGGVAQLTYQASKPLNYTLSAGYTSFVGKTGVKNFTQIPVLLGTKYNLTKDVYVGVEAGASFFDVVRGQFSGARFTYKPSLGVKVGKFDFNGSFISAVDNTGRIGKGGSSVDNTSLSISYKF